MRAFSIFHMLPYNRRLSRKEFEQVYRIGKRLNTSLFSIVFQPKCLPQSQFAVVISKKVSKSSVVRHKLKRQVYESIRLYLKKNTSISYDVIFITYPAIAHKTYEEIKQGVFEALNTFQR